MTRVTLWVTLALVGGCALAATPRAGLAGGDLIGQPGAVGRWEERVARDPYDYAAHQQLVEAYRRAGRYGEAFWEAAWLAWFAPKEQAGSAQGLPYLRDRRARDRAARPAPARPEAKGVEVVVAAVDVERWLSDCCFNGAIAQQSSRLRREVEDTIGRFQSAAGDAGWRDPVARMGLAHIYLRLDDILTLEGREDGGRSREQALRAAATQASAASAEAPEAPGPHRMLAMIRARMAELDGSAEMWELAIAEGREAYRLDPRDATIPEMLWALALRAGRWEEARQWEALVTETPEDDAAPR